jgi:hypothetical protein
MSFGAPSIDAEGDRIMTEAIDFSYDKGVTLIAAFATPAAPDAAIYVLPLPAGPYSFQ